MFAENQRISIRQVKAFVLIDFFGTAVLFLPAQLARSSGYGGWVMILLWGLVLLASAWMLTTLGKREGTFTIVEWSKRCFGGVLGALVAFLVAGVLFLQGALEIRILGEMVCRVMLYDSSVWVPILAFVLFCTGMARHGIECRGRAAEVLFFCIFLPLLGFLLAVTLSIDFWRILPVPMVSMEEMKESTPPLMALFQGLSCLLIVFPYVKKSEKLRKGIVMPIVISTVLIAFLTFLCLGAYGVEMLGTKQYPALQLLGRVSFSGIFLSRQDVLLLWFWVAAGFVFLSGILFALSCISARTFGQKGEGSRMYWVYVWAVLLFIVAMLPSDLTQVYQLRLQWTPWLNGFVFLALPMVLLLIDTIKRRVQR